MEKVIWGTTVDGTKAAAIRVPEVGDWIDWRPESVSCRDIGQVTSVVGNKVYCRWASIYEDEDWFDLSTNLFMWKFTTLEEATIARMTGEIK
jgi:hypothetical protein